MGDSAPVGGEQLDGAIADAVASLHAQVRFAGRLEYGYNRRGRPMQRYNIARHAGTLYALAQHYERVPDARAAALYSEVSRYLATACVRLVPGTEDQYALWGDVEGKPDEAKLGAAGLALAAWCGARDDAQWRPPIDILSGVGGFIAAMQAPDGRFVSKYSAKDGPQTGWQSLYYPGEAALGLVRLYGVDEEPEWLDRAESALLHLADTRARDGKHEPDHWALLATEALWPYAMERERLVAHALGIIDAMLTHVQGSGALTACGRLTPTAIRLEGILAVRDLLPPGHPTTAALASIVPRAVAYLLAGQLRSGRHAGAFPRAPAGSGDPRAAELRVDYTQHALSALLAWRDGCTHLPAGDDAA